MAPPLDAGGSVAPRAMNPDDASPPRTTSAVTRSWSHVDRVKLFATLAATSLAYSLLGHPLFLAVLRQQCSPTHLSVWQALREAYARRGLRGLFRGAGVATSGTVISELIYYLVVEYEKERLPLPTREQRSLVGGVTAELISGPVFNPFAVVSQMQIVSGGAHGNHKYKTAFQTTRLILAERGWRALFRGTLLTVAVSPFTGAWWLLYELLKQRAYDTVPHVSPFFESVIPVKVRQGLPTGCTSTTDNPLVNSVVGALANMMIGVLLNPFYVLRLRLQVAKKVGRTRFPAFWVMRNVFRKEGICAFYKGVRANLFMSAVGGAVFGITYEGAKQFSDITDSNSSSHNTLEMTFQ